MFVGAGEQKRLRQLDNVVHVRKFQVCFCLSCAILNSLHNTLTLSTHFSIPPKLTEWISQAEAARLRGVSRQAIAKLVLSGRLKALDVGGRKFVNRNDVLSFEPNQAG